MSRKVWPSNFDTVEAWYEAVLTGDPSYGRNSSDSIFFEDGIIYSYGRHFPMALRLDSGEFLLNADRYSVTTSAHQTLVRQVVRAPYILIPFSALTSAIGEFSLVRWKNIKPIDGERDKYVPLLRRNPETGEMEETEIHLMGSSLFEFDGDLYLSGLDESGVDPWNSFFLTKLATKDVQTVEEAYESLKPDTVKQAEAEGRKVLRQGEFFFIESEEPPTDKTIKNYWLENRRGDKHHLVTRAKLHNGEIYASGTVRHRPEGPEARFRRRLEHRMLRLGDSWWQVAENVQVESWSSGGRVD